MSAQAPSDSAVDSVAANPSQPGPATSTLLDASRRQPAAASAGPAQLAGQPVTGAPFDREVTKKLVLSALRYFPDFPIPGINFIDILPIFQDPKTFEALLQVLELQIKEELGTIPDVIVGLDARGFLFGPTLALRLNCSFVAVRKKGKMPGPCMMASYEKEYGTDFFQIQADAIKPGQTVLVVDDIIATGKLRTQPSLRPVFLYKRNTRIGTLRGNHTRHAPGWSSLHTRGLLQFAQTPTLAWVFYTLEQLELQYCRTQCQAAKSW